MRISVYVDGANFHYGLRFIHKRYTDFKFDFERFLKDLVKDNVLVDVYYYNASLKEHMNQGLFKQQQQFFERLRKINRFQVILCKRQMRKTDNGEDRYIIKGDDIHLAIDMLKDAYEDKFDKAVLISGDGDFSYLVKYVRIKGKIVDNFHFKENISSDLLNECNSSKVIDKKLANRYFYRPCGTLADTNAGKALLGLIKKM